MNKPYVICHMYTSIDGRIDGVYMEEVGCNFSGEYYDQKIFKVGTSMASGRVTTSMYKAIDSTIDLSNYKDETDEDYIVESENYNFVFDRMGKCFYDNNQYIYAEKVMNLAIIVSSKCDKKYLAYLKEMNISYLTADSIAIALDKISRLFNVESLVLTGGAIINGGFMSEDLIDEISLIVAPYVEGNDEYKTSFSSMTKFNNRKFLFTKANLLKDGGVEIIFKKGQ